MVFGAPRSLAWMLVYYSGRKFPVKCNVNIILLPALLRFNIFTPETSCTLRIQDFSLQHSERDHKRDYHFLFYFAYCFKPLLSIANNI